MSILNVGLIRPRKTNPIGEIKNYVQPSNIICYHQYQKINSHNILKFINLDRLVAYNTLKKWLDKDMVNVPAWMELNDNFRKELTGATSPRLYERVLEKFGLNFVLTAPQAKKLLLKEKASTSTILLVTSAGN